MNFIKLRITAYAAVSILTAAAVAADTNPNAALAINKKPERWKGVTATKKQETKTNYSLPTGFTFTARTETKIWSFNAAAPVIAVVERDIEYLDRIVIPEGTRLIGTVSVEKSLDRVLIDWHTMVFPTGDEIHFPGIALAPDGSIGIPGQVATHKDATIASAVLKSVITGTQAAMEATGTNPVAASATGALSREAVKELDQNQEHATISISVSDYTYLRVYINERLEY